MTTTRDDIAGLSEKSHSDVLREWAKAYRDGPEELRFPSDPNAEFFPVDMEVAATQLDALQARVEELEWANRVYSEQGEELEARALRAEQERDTLARVMEDTATELGCEPNNEVILEAIVGLQQERDEAYERAEKIITSWWAKNHPPVMKRNSELERAIAEILTAIRRLAAGPEKA